MMAVMSRETVGGRKGKVFRFWIYFESRYDFVHGLKVGVREREE